jgi:4-diphosphocytidyl-2-C-methyl-D-erythritol kinase
MQVFAPAKINLSLRILGRGEDGFHEIETLIAPISLCDEIKIDKNAGGLEFRCDDKSVPAGAENLVVRAANAFFRETKLKGGVSIDLKKRIPQGAGLGGGSSDAASTLLALNQLCETKLSRQALAKLGETVGSDVPFFIFASAALCKGRGEAVAPMKLSEALSILLLKPNFGVSSQWAYSRWKDSRELPGVLYKAQKFEDLVLVNELERPVFEKFVFLAQMKMWLLRQPEVGAALMSGSGSTVFAVMRPNADVDSSRRSQAKADLVAKRAKAELDPELWTCAASTL